MTETDCLFNIKARCCCARSENRMKTCPFTDKEKCKYFKAVEENSGNGINGR